MQGSWELGRYKLGEPGAAYDPDQETTWWSRLCCIWGLFELFTCCALGGLLGAFVATIMLLVCGAHHWPRHTSSLN